MANANVNASDGMGMKLRQNGAANLAELVANCYKYCNCEMLGMGAWNHPRYWDVLLLAPSFFWGGKYHRESVEPTHECMNSCMFLCSDVFFLGRFQHV